MTPLTTLGNDAVICLEYRVPFWLLWACTGQRRPVADLPGRALAGEVPSMHWSQQMLLGCAWCGHIPAGQARRPGLRSVHEAAALGFPGSSPSLRLPSQSASCGSEGLVRRWLEILVSSDFQLYGGAVHPSVCLADGCGTVRAVGGAGKARRSRVHSHCSVLGASIRMCLPPENQALSQPASVASCLPENYYKNLLVL